MREIDFQPLNGLMQLVAEVFVDQVDEGFNLFRFERVGASTFENLIDIARLEKRQVMPALEVGVDPGGNGGKQLVERAGEGVGPERRRDEFANDASVEGIPCQTEAAVAEEVFCGAPTFADAGADVQKGEVAGAATEVADENKFIVIEGGFVGVGSGDRFHFKVDGFEACVGEGFAESSQGEVIVLGAIGADKADGTTYRGVAYGLAELLLCAETEVGQDARDEIFDGVAAAEDLRASESAAGEIGLQRLNEAAFVFGVEVVLDAGGASEAFDVSPRGLLVLLQVEDGAEGFGCRNRCGERDEFNVAFSGGEGDGTVGGSEVDADGGKHGEGERHGLSECQILGCRAQEGYRIVSSSAA